MLDSAMYLISLDVARELDRVPEGWPIDDYAEALRVFWREIVDQAVEAGVERYRQVNQ